MTKDEFMKKYSNKWDLTVEWTTGGLTGGSCYGDDANQSVGADPEPDLEILDEILMEEAPMATFMEYRRITKDPKVIIHRTWEDYEYYGNHYSKASKTLDLEALWPYIEIIHNIPDPIVRASHYKLMK